MTAEAQSLLEPNPVFATPVGAETLLRTANALRGGVPHQRPGGDRGRHDGHRVRVGEAARPDRVGGWQGDLRDRRAEDCSDLAIAFRRIEEYSFPLEDARARATYGIGSAINKVLVFNGDRPDRISVVLIHAAIGF